VVVGIRGYRVLRVLDKVLGYRDVFYGKKGMLKRFLLLSRVIVVL